MRSAPIVASSLRRSLRLITAGGCLAMVYTTGIASPAQTEFFRYIGATDFHFGLLGGLPMALVSLQFIGAAIANRIQRRRRLFMFLLIGARLLYVPIIFIPFLFPQAESRLVVAVAIALVTLSSAMNQLATPMWFSWMADLVPRRVLNGYWGSRQRWMYAVWTCSYLAVFLYTYFTDQPVATVFPVLLAVAVLAGVVDILLFLGVDERTNETTRGRRSIEVLVEPFRHREYRSFLVFAATSAAAMMLAATFMQVYALKVLRLTIWQVTLIWAMHGLGNAVSARWWGKLADRHGSRPILRICSAFKPWPPLVFLLITPRTAAWILPLSFFFDAVWNSGLMVANNGYMMKIAPRRNRSMFIAAITGLTGLAGGLAAIGGGWFLHASEGVAFHAAGIDWTNYRMLFAVSFLARVVCVPLAGTVREPTGTRTAHVLLDLFGVWPLRFLRFPTGLYRRGGSRKGVGDGEG